MTLGVALLLIFILYLIDKHNRWRLTFRIVIALLILAALGIGGFYGWAKYGEYREAKQAAAQATAFEAKVKACVARFKTVSSTWDAVDEVSAEDSCKNNTDANPIDLSAGFVPKQPKPSPVPPAGFYPVRATHLKATQDVELTTQEFGTLKCGSVKNGELV